jgi:hypothetical protein
LLPKTPFKAMMIFSRVLFSLLLLIPFSFAGHQVGSIVSLNNSITNTTPIITNVTLNLTNINTNPVYTWLINYSDNQTDIYHWVQPWGTNWHLDNGTLIYMSNDSMEVNTSHMQFPIDDNVTIKDKFVFKDYQILNFSLTNTMDGDSGSNTTYLKIIYNSTLNNRATASINVIWSHENLTNGKLISGGQGATNNLLGIGYAPSIWWGDWLNETWAGADRINELNSTVPYYCWYMEVNLTSFTYNVNYSGLNYTIDLGGINLTGGICTVKGTQQINYNYSYQSVFSNFSTLPVTINTTLLDNGTYIYPTYTQARHEIEITLSYPPGLNTTFGNLYYKNITIYQHIENQSAWALFEWDGTVWVDANISGVNFTILNLTLAQWTSLNVTNQNKTFRIVGVTGGPTTVVSVSSGAPGGGGGWSSPFLPNPNFRIAPRTIDSELGNIIEPFHAYGDSCKDYSVKNIGTDGGLLTLSKFGYTYDLGENTAINSVELFNITPDEIYLVANATSAFKICVDTPPLTQDLEGYVIATGGDASEKILIFMHPPKGKYFEQSILDYLNLVIWESPRPIGGNFFSLRVWHTLLLLVLLLIATSVSLMWRKSSSRPIPTQS